MSNRLLIFLFIVIAFSRALIAQPPLAPSSAPKTSIEAKKQFSWGSIKDLSVSPPFFSKDGRFTIGLKPQIDGYSPLTPNRIGFNASGSEYTWKFDEGEIFAVFLDFPESDLKGSDEELKRITENVKYSVLDGFSNRKLLM